MEPLAVIAFVLIGVGLVMAILGTLRGMIAISPITAYSAGVQPEASAVQARKDPQRVFWSRILVAGVAAVFVGMFLINFV